MDLQISGKKALVLGASRGLGAAIAAGLAAEGVKVFAAARSADKIQATDNITPVTVDLSDVASVAALIAMLAEQGGVDILVNNSGGPKAGPALGQSSESWVSAFQSMATSIFSITDAMMPGMIDRKWGRVITIGSSAWSSRSPTWRSPTVCAPRSPAGRRRWRPKSPDMASPST
jgi:3-oxoacyl-[acyl-carrier protein] reductase